MEQIAYQVTTDPSLEPFTLEEAKGRLEIDGTEQDGYIIDLIKAARQAAENYTNRAFYSQVVKQSFDGFPKVTKYTPKGEFVLAKNVVQNVNSISYTDIEGEPQTLELDNVRLDNLEEPARLYLKYGKSYPSIERDTKVVVEYVAGWDDIGKIPAVIKQAMIFWMREAYDNVGNPPQMKITAFERALSFYRIERI